MWIILVPVETSTNSRFVYGSLCARLRAGRMGNHESQPRILPMTRSVLCFTSTGSVQAVDSVQAVGTGARLGFVATSVDWADGGRYNGDAIVVGRCVAGELGRSCL